VSERRLSDWLAETTELLDLKPSSRSSYGSLTRLMVAFWGDPPIRDLTPLDVQRFASRSGKSASRTRQAVHILRASLGEAVRFGELASNPCDGVKLPRLPRPSGRGLTREEVERLAAVPTPSTPTRGKAVGAEARGLGWHRPFPATVERSFIE
jgi:hypothetical protein